MKTVLTTVATTSFVAALCGFALAADPVAPAPRFAPLTMEQLNVYQKPLGEQIMKVSSVGLGKNVPIFTTNGAESLTAVVDGKIVEMRVPYPAGFFTKLLDARVDDPSAGWKGKGVWTMSGTRTVFHNEGGTTNSPKVYHIQLRPDPLAD